MAFEVEWTKNSKEQLKKLERFISKRIVRKIRTLSEKLLPDHFKKLSGEELFKIRVGNYRILFEKISEDKIRILKIGHRKNIYKR